MTQIVQAVVPCRMDFLDGVITLLESLCVGIDETEVYQIVTAFNEAFTNVVRHSELAEEDPVEVKVRREEDRLTVDIMDGGVTYEKIFEEKTRGGDEPLPLMEGGMGMFIIRQYMHEVRYERSERNTLSMVRYLNQGHEDA